MENIFVNILLNSSLDSGIYLSSTATSRLSLLGASTVDVLTEAETVSSCQEQPLTVTV